MHTGGSEQHIRLHPIQISITQAQLTARGFQRQHFLLCLLPGSTVTAHHIAAKLQQQPHQRPVADTQSQHRDSFAPEGHKILFKGRNHNAFLTP